ncbi:MAG: glycoside hydrolase family 3 protein [Legionellaceae bacterium]|nr:glycoside hydrolase family 3 protein [Legionellaceae bacterium]
MQSLCHKIAQLLILGFDETSLMNNVPFSRFIEQYGVGGVVLFDRPVTGTGGKKNIDTQEQIRALTQSVHERCRNACGETPLICIDYEGGRVDRLAKVAGVPSTPSAQEMATMDCSDFENTVRRMAQTLRDLGFNLNFAPVVDLALSSEQGIIAPLQRSFGSDSKQVAHLASQFVQLMQEYHIASCLKHFPGHGSASGDTHTEFVDVSDSFVPTELWPYHMLQNMSHLPVSVMTAHIINRQLDREGRPATLSAPIIQDLLRKECAFNGVVISDDLQMHAISRAYSMPKAMVAAIHAGCDMLIIANQIDRHTPEELLHFVETAVHNGQLTEAQLDEAIYRVQRLKRCINTAPLAEKV